MKKEELKAYLDSKKIGKMKKAVKFIAKNNIEGFENEIIDNYIKYRKREKNWEFNIHLLNVIYIQRYESAIPFIKEIVYINLEHDIITQYSALVYSSLMSINEEDVSIVLELSEFCNFSVGVGILNMLGVEEKIPSINEQFKIIEIFKNFGNGKSPGYGDPRVGLAAACINWNAKNVKEFLNLCLQSDNDNLVEIANNSLLGKKTKYHEYLLFYK